MAHTGLLERAARGPQVLEQKGRLCPVQPPPRRKQLRPEPQVQDREAQHGHPGTPRGTPGAAAQATREATGR